MSKTPEGIVKQRVKNILRPYVDSGELYVNWPVPAGFGMPMLDAVGCHRGDFFMIETKAEGQCLTPRQNLIKNEVLQAGGKVFEIYGIAGNEDDPDTWPGFTELEQWLSRK